ncbi:hypothetical protein HW44_10315 [Nitrosococcus oceani]|nr:hypothetical protein HW44_10315 [Nitrosococcus oceani]
MASQAAKPPHLTSIWKLALTTCPSGGTWALTRCLPNIKNADYLLRVRTEPHRGFCNIEQLLTTTKDEGKHRRARKKLSYLAIGENSNHPESFQ